MLLALKNVQKYCVIFCKMIVSTKKRMCYSNFCDKNNIQILEKFAFAERSM